MHEFDDSITVWERKEERNMYLLQNEKPALSLSGLHYRSNLHRVLRSNRAHTRVCYFFFGDIACFCSSFLTRNFRAPEIFATV